MNGRYVSCYAVNKIRYFVSIVTRLYAHKFARTYSRQCRHDKKTIMTSEGAEKDLVDAVRESLKRDGRLGRFKAELRSAVMSILNKSSNDANLPQLPEETRLINELIREYLVWNGYVYSEQVLVAESGQHSERLPREHLAAKLNVMDDERTLKIPLMYYIVAAFQSRENED